MKNNKWYIAGLHFECFKCGNCCAGPDEGYIWITKPEINLLTKYLKMNPDQLRRKFLKRLGPRTTIIEEPKNKDCIFLTRINHQKGCAIYPVRPNQCRTWPFWPENLKTPNTWNASATKCPGINRGKLYTFEQIEKIKSQKKWWTDEK